MKANRESIKKYKFEKIFLSDIYNRVSCDDEEEKKNYIKNHFIHQCVRAKSI